MSSITNPILIKSSDYTLGRIITLLLNKSTPEQDIILDINCSENYIIYNFLRILPKKYGFYLHIKCNFISPFERAVLDLPACKGLVVSYAITVTETKSYRQVDLVFSLPPGKFIMNKMFNTIKGKYDYTLMTESSHSKKLCRGKPNTLTEVSVEELFIHPTAKLKHKKFYVTKNPTTFEPDELSCFYTVGPKTLQPYRDDIRLVLLDGPGGMCNDIHDYYTLDSTYLLFSMAFSVNCNHVLQVANRNPARLVVSPHAVIYSHPSSIENNITKETLGQDLVTQSEFKQLPVFKHKSFKGRGMSYQDPVWWATGQELIDSGLASPITNNILRNMSKLITNAINNKGKK